ncbi:MAG: hypothetical protein IKE43_09485 [Coriobacteriales bacterium]|nr:hypothetical protein [Coriobacteriales bacterium]
MYIIEQSNIEPFEFANGDKNYSVPSLRGMSVDDVLAFNEASKHSRVELTEFMIGYFKRMAPESIDGLNLSQLTGLFKAWQETAGDVDAGESQASEA